MRTEGQTEGRAVAEKGSTKENEISKVTGRKRSPVKNNSRFSEDGDYLSRLTYLGQTITTKNEPTTAHILLHRPS
jgi:hypothetical protein